MRGIHQGDATVHCEHCDWGEHFEEFVTLTIEADEIVVTLECPNCGNYLGETWESMPAAPDIHMYIDLLRRVKNHIDNINTDEEVNGMLADLEEVIVAAGG